MKQLKEILLEFKIIKNNVQNKIFRTNFSKNIIALKTVLETLKKNKNKN